MFCSHRTGEHVSPTYLARFYSILHYALRSQVGGGGGGGGCGGGGGRGGGVLVAVEI